MKTCSKCKIKLTEEKFFKHKRTKDGLRSECKFCTKKINETYANKNKIKMNEYHLEYSRTKYAASDINLRIPKTKVCPKCKTEKISDDFFKSRWSGSGLQSTRKDCSIERHFEWIRRNPERWSEHLKRSYAKNKEKREKTKREWRLKNPEKVARYAKVSYEKRKLILLEQQRIRRSQNRDKARVQVRNRRARIAGANGFLSEEDWINIKLKYSHLCLSCLKSEPEISLTMDHVLPVIKGGSNYPGNIQPLCGKCNSSKSKKYKEFRFDRLLPVKGIDGETVNASKNSSLGSDL